jgi:hypothetical protein
MPGINAHDLESSQEDCLVEPDAFNIYDGTCSACLALQLQCYHTMNIDPQNAA